MYCSRNICFIIKCWKDVKKLNILNLIRITKKKWLNVLFLRAQQEFLLVTKKNKTFILILYHWYLRVNFYFVYYAKKENYLKFYFIPYTVKLFFNNFIYLMASRKACCLLFFVSLSHRERSRWRHWYDSETIEKCIVFFRLLVLLFIPQDIFV